MAIGIEAISFYTPHYYIDLKTLAEARSVEVDKFYQGIGQEKMAVPPPGEDIVTMAANAAQQALQNSRREQIDTLLFATESGIDQSKAAGIYVHHLLDLPKNCRVVELKQACYSATAGLQMAVPLIAAHPHRDRKVLLIAADVARYGLGTPGEATQGAGAAAMIISANPHVMAIDPEAGFYSEDVMDFWRPNYRDEALVDGKYSVKIYLKALMEAWQQYSEESGRSFSDFSRFCYHLPFSRMAEKAHQHLAKFTGHQDDPPEILSCHIQDSLHYNRTTGNSYAASLYIGLTSLLDNSQVDLTNHRIGMFSYGSGCVGEFFSGVIQPHYQKSLFSAVHRRMLESRQELSYEEYESFYSWPVPTDGGDYNFPQYETGKFRLNGISKHKRIYERLG
jgi:hydroxymethylglutaryl-CoA synthase